MLVTLVDRIERAALEQFTETGIRRTSVEDVARRAGVARVTVYRHVGGKDALVALVLGGETRRAMTELDAAVAGAGSPAEVLERSFSVLVRFVREHPLFDTLLRREPETLLPPLTIHGQAFLDLYRSLVGERLAELQRNGEIDPPNLERAAEAIARMAMSLVLTPSALLDADDPQAVAAFARETLLPMLRPQG